nr:PREDICTED: LOW QUALITY PROTEIN: insulin receptor substrate 2 [Anolis carolinensis]|eukprot:XP_016851693.1 PREDICTED: LOW QUALITY PROTEIN: insulin receptor substrate 2 [Anolis carolinensis]
MEPPGRASSAGALLSHNNSHTAAAATEPQPPLPPPPPPPLPPDVRKTGYLRKHHKHGHRRFFVLRGPPGEGSQARLEYYESEKKWLGKASPVPKRSLTLEGCLQVHKRADARHRHLVALFARGESWALAAESAEEQEGWYRAIAALLPAAGGEDEDDEGGGGGGLEDDFLEVWQVSVRARGLGQSRGLSGVQRLCLARRSVALVRLKGERPSVALPLMSIRRCGHSDGFFFLELGRSAATGPGELWMQAGDAVVAQSIHETVLGAMRALREPRCPARPRSKSQSSSSASSASSSSSSSIPPSCVAGPSPSRDPPAGPDSSSALQVTSLAPCGEGDSPQKSPQKSNALTSEPRSSSSTPETPPPLGSYVAMDHLGAPRKRTLSLTAPVQPCLVPLASASLDEYTLMRATQPCPRVAAVLYPEDYCDLEACSVGKEEGYMPMAPRTMPILPLQDACLSLSPTGVSPSHPLSSGSSSDDSGYMQMWGTGPTKLSRESPARGDYINMSPLLFPSLCGPSPASSSEGYGTQSPGEQPGCFCSAPWTPGERKNSDQYMLMSSPGTPYASWASGERKNSDQYVMMSSPGVPKAEGSYAAMPFPIHHSRMEPFLSRHSLRLSLPSREEPPTLNEPQSPSGEYVNISYSQAPLCDGPTFLLGSSLGNRSRPCDSSYTNIRSGGSQSSTLSVGSLEEALLPEVSPSPEPSGKPYVKVGVEQACLSSPLSEAGDYTEMFFTTATAPPQPISHKLETVRVSSPVSGLKRLTLSGMETFLLASPPPDPNHGAKVIRADPQGRRRHSSETFSSTTTVTPVSPSFAHKPKRHNSASVENVSLRKNEGLVEEQNGSPMCRETSAGFQHGLNHIALEGDHLANAYQGKHKGKHPLNGSIDGTYTTIDFRNRNLNEASSVKVC